MPSVAQHLSQIQTSWTLLNKAHDLESTSIHQARQQLLIKYEQAVRRYLFSAVKDQATADDLSQEFALRFVRGDFRNAHPEKGRFRYYLKTSLHHLIKDHFRAQQRQAGPLVVDIAETPNDNDGHHSDEVFHESWRSEVMQQAWNQLARFELEHGQPLMTVLQLRVQHPDKNSVELADILSGQLGRAVTDGWVRKQLHQARTSLAIFIVEEVRATLADAGSLELEDELQDLGLLEYCRKVLKLTT